MEIIRGKTKNIPIPMSYADWRLSLSQINKSDATDTGPAASKVSATCFPNWICSSLAALVSLLLPYFAPQLCILAQKSMDDTVDLTGDGGVLKTIIRKPRHDELAPSDSIPVVDVHYEGTLAETGEVFDTTHEDNSVFSFEVGSGTVIKAWDIALRTMKVGEICKITCKPDYAYGSVGSPPEIPPNATLVFEVELVACRPRKGASLGSVSDEKARLQELKKQRESIAASKEEEKKKREEAKAAAAARIQAKLESKKSQGKGKGKAK